MLLGGGNLSATGNNLANSLIGNGGANILDGRGGDDTMAGGAGNDTYIVDRAGDVVIEEVAGGTDVVNAAVSYTLSDNVENLVLTGTASINGTGNGLNNSITGNAGNNILDGGAGADILTGGAGNDTYVVDSITDKVMELADGGTDLVQASVSFTLAANVENLVLTGTGAINGTGNALANRITGNGGNNILTGGAGIDTMVGGMGDDTYVVDVAGETVIEAAGEGVDTVMSAVTYVLGANLECLILTGTAALNGTGNALDNSLTGNTGANTLNGGTGNDTMAGGAGNDSYIVDALGDVVIEAANAGTDLVTSSVSYALTANVENLVLTGVAITATGNALNNNLSGNGLANVLDGGAGADTMAGGLGNDTYVVDSAGDVVTEAASAGTDTVQSSVNYVLGDNVENLILMGTAAINGMGNALNNSIAGNTGANLLDGGFGNDTMAGGMGDDTYIVDAAGDVVQEAEAAGIDTVKSAITYVLGANLENLVLTGTAVVNGTGNALANSISGNSANNVLNGGAGNDTMSGGAGDDSYVVDASGDVVVEGLNSGIDTVTSSISYALSVNVENLVLTGTDAINATGNNLANSLTGNAGANMIDGGAGNDTMAGGLGDDTYIVDQVLDVVRENAAQGIDTVRASVDYALSANVENLELYGTALIATGNSLDNRLTGNSGANLLDGLGGNDTMSGGGGNDTYIVDAAGDVVIEAANGGTDLVKASIDQTLADYVENLLLTGAAAVRGTGNAMANSLTGNVGNNILDGGAGNDTLSGGLGNDTLIGGLGNDVFIWNHGDGSDIINEVDDLASSADQLWLKDTSSGQISFQRSGSDVTLVIAPTLGAQDGGSVKLLNLDVLGQRGVDSIILKDETWTASALRSKVLAAAATTGNDIIRGFDGSADLISGGLGNDVLTGLGGNDRFAFAGVFGNDKVTDFMAGTGATDVLQLSLGSAYDSFAEVRAVATQVNADTVFNFGALGSITLQNVAMSSMVADDFMFV